MSAPQFPAARATLALLAFAAGLAAQGGAPPPAPRPRPAPEATAEGRCAGTFRTEVSIEVPPDAQALELWVPAPRIDGYQTVTDTIAPAPAGTTLAQDTDPDDGNTFLHLRTRFPRGVVTFAAQWRVERREAVRAPFRRGTARTGAPLETFARDLAPARLMPIAGRVNARANMIEPDEKDTLNLGRAIYDEVLATLKPGGRGEGGGQGDVLFALDAGWGDDVDFASLFVALARARGIPARFHTGFPLPRAADATEAVIDGHLAWAEFFVPDIGWIPVDPGSAARSPEKRQYAFGNLDERRVWVTSGRDVKTAPESRRAPHNCFIYPYAEIDGEPAPVIHRFTFKEM